MKLLPQIGGKKNRRRKLVLLLITLSIGSFMFLGSEQPAGVNAQSDTGVWSQINSLQSRMAQLNQSIQSEQSQINALHGRIKGNTVAIANLQTIIAQKQQLISDKQDQINLLNQSISDEKSQIDALNARINTLYAEFVQRAKASYETSYMNPFLIALGNKSVVDALASLEYFANTRKQDSALISDMKNNDFILQQKLDDLNVQQTDLVNAQNELQNEQKDLQNQQNELQVQIASDTSNTNSIQHQLNANQQKYAQIVEQINALQIATFGGSSEGCVGGNWWYYNQQCYGRLAGMYGTSIDMRVGCLITDIAMVATKELGSGYTPPVIASLTYFDGQGDMMEWPVSRTDPSALLLTPTDLGYRNISAINAQLDAGNPVIVYLAAPNGEHWVVFFGTTPDGDFIINDPWYGSSLRFNGTGGGTHEYYSTGEIGQAFILK